MSSSVQEILQKKIIDNSSEIKKRNIISSSTTNHLISLNSENIEEAAITSLQRMMLNWDSSLERREEEIRDPEDYSKCIQGYWETYQKFRMNLDASFAFVAGDILNTCRKKFFSSQEKNFKKYLETQIPFSLRLAYDFMAISKELSAFKNKKLTMEKLRALLSVARSGLDLTQIYSHIEELKVKEILSLKQLSKEKKKVHHSFKMGQMSLCVLTLEKQVNEIFIDNTGKNLTSKQLSEIFIAQEKIKSILSLIEKNISCYLK